MNQMKVTKLLNPVISLTETNKINLVLLECLLFHLFNKPKHQFSNHIYSAQLINEITSLALVCCEWFDTIIGYLEKNPFINQYFKKLLKSNIKINSRGGLMYKVVRENYLFKEFLSFENYKNEMEQNNLNHHQFEKHIIKIKDYSVPLKYENSNRFIPFNYLPVELDLYLNTSEKKTQEYLDMLLMVRKEFPNIKVRKVKLIGQSDDFILDTIVSLCPKSIKYDANNAQSQNIKHLDYSPILQSTTLEKFNFIKSDHVDPHVIGMNLQPQSNIKSLTIPIAFHDICRFKMDMKQRKSNGCDSSVGVLNYKFLQFNSFELMCGAIAANTSIKELTLSNFCKNSKCISNIDPKYMVFLNNGLKRILESKNNKIESLCIESLDFINDTFYEALAINQTIKSICIKDMNLLPFLNNKVFKINRNIQNIIIYNENPTNDESILAFKFIVDVLLYKNNLYSISINDILIKDHYHELMLALKSISPTLYELNIFGEKKQILKYRVIVNKLTIINSLVDIDEITSIPKQIYLQKLKAKKELEEKQLKEQQEREQIQLQLYQQQLYQQQLYQKQQEELYQQQLYQQQLYQQQLYQQQLYQQQLYQQQLYQQQLYQQQQYQQQQYQQQQYQQQQLYQQQYDQSQNQQQQYQNN